MVNKWHDEWYDLKNGMNLISNQTKKKRIGSLLYELRYHGLLKSKFLNFITAWSVKL